MANKATIRCDYGVFEVHEIRVDWNGLNFLVIYGKHGNGWFIAIPNWNICVEVSEPGDCFYNAGKLSVVSRSVSNNEAGKVIAEAIKDHWEGLQNG